MIEYKNFRSPSGDIHLSSTLGHSVIISNDLTPVSSLLWGQAYAAGAVSEDMKTNDMASYLEEKKKEVVDAQNLELKEIKDKIREIYLNPVSFVDSTGKLLNRKVIAHVGKPIKKDVIDSIWAELVEEAEV